MTTALDRPSDVAEAQPAGRRPLGWTADLAAALIPAALLTLYSLIPQPPYGAKPFEDAWRRHVLIAIALLLWWGALLMRRRLPRLERLSSALLLLLAVQAAAMATSTDWRIGLEPALDLVAAILIFCALAGCPGLSARSIRWALMLTALALSVACLHFVWDRWLDWRSLTQSVPDAASSLLPPTIPRVLGVGTNPNIIAPEIVMIAPLYLLAILRSERWRRAVVLAAAAVLQVAIFFTLSRSAWAGETAGVAVTVLLLLSARRRPNLPWRRITLSGAATALGLVSAVALTLAAGWRPLWLFRQSFSARSDFRVAALLMLERHPLLGSGPGSFAVMYPYISNGDPLGAVHSHNIPLQIGVETGLLGLLAALLVAAAAGSLLIRVWRRGGPEQRRIVACAAGGAASFAIAGMGDSLHLFPELLFVLGGLMALAVRSGDQRRTDVPTGAPPGLGAGRPVRVGLALVPAALTIVLLGAWLRSDQAWEQYSRSIDLASQQRWAEAVSAAERASAIDPSMAIYYVQGGSCLEIQAQYIAPGDLDAQIRSGHAFEAAALRARSIASLQKALHLEPRSANAQFALATVLFSSGKTRDALALLPQVESGAPRDSLLLFGAGVMQEPDAPDSAGASYAAALAESPRLADSPFWRENDYRRRAYGQIVKQALTIAGSQDSSSGPAAAQQILADGAELSVAERVVLPSSGYIGEIDRAERIAATGHLAAAGDILLRAARNRPDDPAVRLALGDLLFEESDRRSARGQWVAGAYLGDAASILRLGDTSPNGVVPPRVLRLAQASLTGLFVRQFEVTQQHYRFVYRRQEPWPVVLPGDWLNALPEVYSSLKAAEIRWEAAEAHAQSEP